MESVLPSIVLLIVRSWMVSPQTVMVSELEGCTLLLPDLEFFFQAGLLFPSSARGSTPSRYSPFLSHILSLSLCMEAKVFRVLSFN